MSKAVLMSLNPKWLNMILCGTKTKEVRKRAPLLQTPFKVYLYCTKGDVSFTHGTYKAGRIWHYQKNGMVCGEATCVSITEVNPPFRNAPCGSCLSPKELYEYAGTNKNLSFMALENPITYDEPKSLSEFGLKKAPQSWQYVEERAD